MEEGKLRGRRMAITSSVREAELLAFGLESPMIALVERIGVGEESRCGVSYAEELGVPVDGLPFKRYSSTKEERALPLVVEGVGRLLAGRGLLGVAYSSGLCALREGVCAGGLIVLAALSTVCESRCSSSAVRTP